MQRQAVRKCSYDVVSAIRSAQFHDLASVARNFLRKNKLHKPRQRYELEDKEIFVIDFGCSGRLELSVEYTADGCPKTLIGGRTPVQTDIPVYRLCGHLKGSKINLTASITHLQRYKKESAEGWVGKERMQKLVLDCTMETRKERLDRMPYWFIADAN